MDFDFSDEQIMLRDTLRDLLRRECTPAQVRAAWEQSDGGVTERWRSLARTGVLGLTVPEDHGGSGLGEVDLVLLLEEAGRHALPEPLLETVAVGAPLLARAGSDEVRGTWLPRVATGDAVVSIGLAATPFVVAGDADLVILERDGALHALTQDRLSLTPLRSVDGARRLFEVTAAETSADTRLPGDQRAWAFEHAAAATAAELAGVAGALLDRTVAYVQQREQFGRKIGSFQAVQHKLAETLLLVESARSAVYYAAYALAEDLPDASVAVSMAKAYAGDAERRANTEALQLHGGIGFTWEHDLHFWLKRGMALERAYGDADWHRDRIAAHVYRS